MIYRVLYWYITFLKISLFLESNKTPIFQLDILFIFVPCIINEIIEDFYQIYKYIEFLEEK